MSQVFISAGGRQAVSELIRSRFGADVRLIHDADGAPCLIGADEEISISHSRHYAALMVSTEGRCGVDIEEPRIEQLTRVRAKFMTPEELAAPIDLLMAWTAKEAVFKAAGTPGLGLSMIDTLSQPGFALIPDGRRFRLSSTVTPDYTLTTALPDD
ncbi:MAG: 4'-phosphopantetheinyl transferase superfamily protein [Bacteroides sp.]|nr:4'-phosphopantetheinyl transferase superfamily protein [Bacteroides sp.]